MGWTTYNATCYKNGKIDRKAECDSYFERNGGYEVLKSQMVGTVYYAAVKKTGLYVSIDHGYKYVDIPIEKQYVFAAVFLTMVDMKDYCNFGYKDMSDADGPAASDCPASILKLLTPTDNEWANEWRKRCWKNIEKRKNKRIDAQALSNLPIGSEITFNLNGNDYKLMKRAPAYQFKKPWWYNRAKNTYFKVKDIPDNYTVTNAAVVSAK